METKKNEKKTIIYFPTWMQAMMHLKYETCVNNVAKKTGITYSHIHKIVKDLEKFGLATTKKQGRERKITITPKGIEIAQNILKIKTLLGEKNVESKID